MNNKEILNPEGNSFRQTRIKLQNPALGNDRAWIEAQPLFEEVLSGYPNEYQSCQVIMRRIFDIRRSTFLVVQKMDNSLRGRGDVSAKNKTMTQATEAIKEIIPELDPQTRERLQRTVVIIRDLFNVPVPPTGRRRG